MYPLRIIEHSPIPRGFLPKPGASKAKVYLYPVEEARLLACKEVPLVFRVLYGVLAREGMREGEAVSLKWGRLDLERGAISLDENKTDEPRAWALDSSVVRALKVWKELHGNPDANKRVFLDANGGVLDDMKFAKLFREQHLKAAGVHRAELFERSKNRIPIRVQDLRATFVTLSLANAKSEAWVTDRTGHK